MTYFWVLLFDWNFPPFALVCKRFFPPAIKCLVDNNFLLVSVSHCCCWEVSNQSNCCSLKDISFPSQHAIAELFLAFCSIQWWISFHLTFLDLFGFLNLRVFHHFWNIFSHCIFKYEFPLLLKLWFDMLDPIIPYFISISLNISVFSSSSFLFMCAEFWIISMEFYSEFFTIFLR